MKKPSVFISSTIYDFKDLRSALKYWLTEMGFEAQSSETNDFDVDTNKNSYEACLDTIEKCDFFILLIGSRVGGWYDKEKQVSITMAEYNKVYELACEGKIKIINFVRKEIFDIKEDRKSLETYLKEQKDISDEQKINITYHSSRFMNNAEFIMKFINQVTKNTEMKASLDKNAALPNANWIFQFSNYEDIIDVLKIQLNISINIREIVDIENLKSEIINNLKVLSKMKNGKLLFDYHILNDLRTRFPDRIEGLFRIKKAEIATLELMIIIFISIQHKMFSSIFIKQSFQSGIFFEYDKFHKNMHETNMHKALVDLNKNIDLLELGIKFLFENFNDLLNQLDNIYNNSAEEDIDINLSKFPSLIMLFSTYDKIDNIVVLSTFILFSLVENNYNLTCPELKPIYSIRSIESERMVGKVPTTEDILQGLKLDE